MKSLYLIGVSAMVAFSGTFLTGELSKILTTQQQVGMIMEVLGLAVLGLSAGWFFRSEQPDLKQKSEEHTVNDFKCDNRDSQ